MTRVVMAKDGDVLDEIALETYGRTLGATEALMDANPHLAGGPSRLTAGTPVILPDLPAAIAKPRVRLWD